MLFLGGPMIRWLRQKRWRKDVKTDAEAWQVREDTPETHLVKQGTPSMGGIGIIGVACAVYLAVCFLVFAPDIITMPRPVRSDVWAGVVFLLLLPATVGAHALLGFADDWSKASGRGGLRARAKLLGQLGLEAVFLGALAVCLYGVQSFRGSGNPNLATALFPKLPADYGVWGLALVFLLLMLAGTCNAVNLTDGIDGLAAGLAVQAGIAFVLLLFPESDYGLMAVLFWTALAGSCLGFLAYNKYPAKVFMGDTGSLALGAALGCAAIMTHAVFLLPFIAFIYFVEAASVTLQVLYFKYTKRKTGEGKRIFRRAPLHHHFELGGWSEWRVVLIFWMVNLVTTALGLVLWHMKILPRFP